MTPQAILALSCYSTDAGTELSVREVLQQILLAAWREGRFFQPGAGLWHEDIRRCLVIHGLVPGDRDTDNAADDAAQVNHTRQLITDCILVL